MSFEVKGEFNCPYCDIEGAHGHAIDQHELELMRGCQRAFELQLQRWVAGESVHSLFWLKGSHNDLRGFFWSDPEPRRVRYMVTAWNARNGTEYLEQSVQRMWDLWRAAWRGARSAQTVDCKHGD